MYCRKCGKRLPEDSQSCKECGAELTPAQGDQIGVGDIDSAAGVAVGRRAQGMQTGDVEGLVIQAQGDVVLGKSMREDQYRTALNWDGKRSLRGFDLSKQDLSEVELKNADLRGANLSRADLRGAKLSGANLHRANLSGARLVDAYLDNADLSEANLSFASLTRTTFLYPTNLLSGVNLHGANLIGANLHNAYLKDADLSEANLTFANLTRTFLYQTNLTGADLRGADLRGAQLASVDLSRANLTGAVVGTLMFGRRVWLVDRGRVNWNRKVPDASDFRSWMNPYWYKEPVTMLVVNANLSGTTMPDGTVHE